VNNGNKPTTITTGRYPICKIADDFCKALVKFGFSPIDQGDGLEVEYAEVSFPTWKEPIEFFSWQKHPLKTRRGLTVLRTRLLPAHLRKIAKKPPLRLLASGRVYKRDKKNPMHHQIEGIAIEDGLTIDNWKALWQDFALEVFSEDSEILFELISDDAYKISVRNSLFSEPITIGFSGSISEQTRNVCCAGESSGWIFAIDIDQYIKQFYCADDIFAMYKSDCKFLSQFTSDEPAFGYTPAHTAIDILRKMGYQEIRTDALYEEDAYIREGMIQAAWDKNNQGYALLNELGDLTALRTVLTPGGEEVMGYNRKNGITDLRVFDVSHIYLPKDKQTLPKEQYGIFMGAFGSGLNFETFKKEVKEFLEKMGLRKLKFAASGIASAYKWNECMFVMDDDEYVKASFGRICKQACRSYGIYANAYMANFELDALVKSANKNI
jgi:phenylalanyl-tRNA synthetase alpha subunit